MSFEKGKRCVFLKNFSGLIGLTINFISYHTLILHHSFTSAIIPTYPTKEHFPSLGLTFANLPKTSLYPKHQYDNLISSIFVVGIILLSLALFSNFPLDWDFARNPYDSKA